MAQASGLSRSAMHRIWRAFALQPHRSETFKLSRIRCSSRRCATSSGCICTRPDRALVLCVDEKSSDPGARSDPAAAADAARAKWSGGPTTTRGTARPRCLRRWTPRPARSSGSCIGAIGPSSSGSSSTRSMPRSPPTWTCISSWTTTAPTRRALIQRWLAKRPRFHVHFTPTSASWLNLVERWFAALTEKQIKRGAHAARGRSKRRSASTSPSPTAPQAIRVDEDGR